MEPRESLSVKSREGGEYVDVKWLPDSSVYRTLITESLYNKHLKVSPWMKLRKNTVKFTVYASTQNLLVLGRVKLVLKSTN